LAGSFSRPLAVLAVLVCVWGVAYFVALEAQGVPIAWVLSRFRLLSVTQGNLSVTVSPEVPIMLGDQITVAVVDSETLEPVQGASVTVSKDGSHVYDLQTDEKGTASFAYPGEATIIVISKLTYATETRVIPRIPDSWVRGEADAWIASTVTAIVAALVAALIMRGRRF
jgi:hypothetical protein